MFISYICHGSELYLVAECESSNILLCNGHFMEIKFFWEKSSAILNLYGKKKPSVDFNEV